MVTQPAVPISRTVEDFQFLRKAMLSIGDNGNHTWFVFSFGLRALGTNSP